MSYPRSGAVSRNVGAAAHNCAFHTGSVIRSQKGPGHRVEHKEPLHGVSPNATLFPVATPPHCAAEPMMAEPFIRTATLEVAVEPGAFAEMLLRMQMVAVVE